jgi:hypothetical protein
MACINHCLQKGNGKLDMSDLEYAISIINDLIDMSRDVTANDEGCWVVIKGHLFATLWVLVSEPPKDGQHVLTNGSEFTFPRIMAYSNGTFWERGDNMTKYVERWMNLPE